MVARLGPLELLVRLAVDGSTRLYLAREPGGRIVLVKLLDPRVPARKKERFRETAELVSRLAHPNLVGVTGHGEVDGIPALATEYVLGFDLSATLAASARSERPLPAEVVLRLAAMVARGLHAAHELSDAHGRPVNLVHRDVRPENVWVAFNGEAKLGGFDLLRSDDDGAATEPGLRLMPIRSISPEQLGYGEIDRRADVFGVGRLLWEALVGRPLVPSNDVRAVHRALLSEPFARPSQAAPGVPAGVDAVVMRALEREPARRQPTAATLADEIDDLLRRARRTVDASDVAVALVPAFGERIPRLAMALRGAMAGRANEAELAELCGGAAVTADELSALAPAVYDDETEATMAAPTAKTPVVFIDEDPPTEYAGPQPPRRPAPPPRAATSWNRTEVRTLSAEDLNEILGRPTISKPSEPAPRPSEPASPRPLPGARRVRPAPPAARAPDGRAPPSTTRRPPRSR